jgi:PKD repeat protein
VATLASVSCDKMPLLAPSGSVITLFSNNAVMSVHGTIEITATVIEQGAAAAAAGGSAAGGQPVHNGTVVSFTTTIGSIDPKEARTHNGQVNVRLIGNGQSGTASVLAYSGGAKSAELKVLVGTAAIDHLVVSADPQVLPPSGGTTQISARAEDVSGNAMADIPVTFTLTSGLGTLAPANAVTDSSGVARATLTAGQRVEVTATAGAKTGKVTVDIGARTGITLSAPASPPSAGSPASFTVGVASAANVREVTVSWGDGSTSSLGSISGNTTVTHVYARDGTYTATATATDASGNRESVSTSVTVLQASPVAVTLTASPTSPTTGQAVTFTASATAPSGASIVRFDWDFDDGDSDRTTGGSVSHVYSVGGPKTVRVTAMATNGATGTGQTIVTVTAQTPITVTLTPSSTSPAINQTVTFTAATGTLPSGAVIVRYDWNFGDLLTQSTTVNTATHIYTSTGPKDITVTVVLSTGATGTGLTTVIVTNPPPVSVVLSANPPNPLVGATVTFTANHSTLPGGVTIVRYHWDFGDGSAITITTGNTTTHPYGAVGAKNVTVTIDLSNGTTAIGQTTVNVS